MQTETKVYILPTTNLIMKIRCSNNKCNNEWNYNGENHFYACCPRCRSSINIEKNKVSDETQNWYRNYNVKRIRKW